MWWRRAGPRCPSPATQTTWRPSSAGWQDLGQGFAGLLAAFPAAPDRHGLRSVIDVAVTRISDTCGYAVPLMEYQGDRDLLGRSHARRSAEQLADYRATRNAVSLDGLPALS